MLAKLTLNGDRSWVRLIGRRVNEREGLAVSDARMRERFYRLLQRLMLVLPWILLAWILGVVLLSEAA